jgi:hypothetical protein
VNGAGTLRAFEAYGVRCAIRAEREELGELVASALPPVRDDIDSSTATVTFDLEERDSSIAVLVDGDFLGSSPDREVAAGILDSAVRARIALRAPERIFVHAGAVSHRGHAIVIPGRSFSGKTTLVAALLASGATYLSDEFAVLDEAGMVHAYPRPLGVRAHGSREQHLLEPAELGHPIAPGPVPVGLIVITAYRPGARWDPSERTSGEGALALLANTVPARERSAEALRAVRAAATGAVVIETDRGDAAEAARHLLA